MKTGIEQLTLDERLKYLRIMRARYQQADRQTKTALLDQMVAVTGLHRKSVLRQPGGDLQRHPRSTERSATYGPEVQAALTSFNPSCTWSRKLIPQHKTHNPRGCTANMIKPVRRSSDFWRSRC
ncbi:MAG TPA: hypothetical protein PLQ85_05870 [Anaerolineae bacterium]|nr:hypothetical protein [Anaerolineae bacterium]